MLSKPVLPLHHGKSVQPSRPNRCKTLPRRVVGVGLTGFGWIAGTGLGGAGHDGCLSACCRASAAALLATLEPRPRGRDSCTRLFTIRLMTRSDSRLAGGGLIVTKGDAERIREGVAARELCMLRRISSDLGDGVEKEIRRTTLPAGLVTRTPGDRARGIMSALELGVVSARRGSASSTSAGGGPASSASERRKRLGLSCAEGED